MVTAALFCIAIAGLILTLALLGKAYRYLNFRKAISERFKALSDSDQLRLIAAVFGKELSDNKDRFNRLLSDPHYTITPEDSCRSEEIVNKAKELMSKASESSPFNVFIKYVQSAALSGPIDDYFENRQKYSDILEAELNRYTR